MLLGRLHEIETQLIAVRGLHNLIRFVNLPKSLGQIIYQVTY